METKIKQLKQEIAEKQRELAKMERGYFDGVETWAQAIELLEKANDKGWAGEFVEIDGRIHFDLCMSNTTDWNFSKGRKLLTEGDKK